METILSILRSKFFITGLVIILNIFSQVLYKNVSLANNRIDNDFSFIFSTLFNIKVMAGMLFQIFGLVLWFFILRKYDLIWSALMSSLIPVGLILSGYYLFNESLTINVIIGSLFVVAGLFIINIK